MQFPQGRKSKFTRSELAWRKRSKKVFFFFSKILVTINVTMKILFSQFGAYATEKVVHEANSSLTPRF